MMNGRPVCDASSAPPRRGSVFGRRRGVAEEGFLVVEELLERAVDFDDDGAAAP